ncbi:MAG TPA: GUN4 domain-containing protein [Coleofasciculaceae cyanobacterium]
MSEEIIKLFYSYSRKDLDMRNALEDHLAALREANRIQTWHDLELEAGTEWEPAILNKLNTADIILLLVSRNFIASKYCYGTELKRAIARHDEGTARVIPIILSSCDWNHPHVPFSKLNVLPTHAKPIKSWADPDDAFTIVAQKIRETVDQLIAKKQAEQEAAEVKSDRGIDYKPLRDLLKAGKWKEADQEAAERMCEVMGRQEEGWLREEDIEQFPCTDLRTIDQLWVKYSDGKFGFSVQKKIWEECGSPMKPNDDWEKFGYRIGWRNHGKWMNYSQLTFDQRKSLTGELPKLVTLGLYGVSLWFGFSSLAQRLVVCSTSQS